MQHDAHVLRYLAAKQHDAHVWRREILLDYYDELHRDIHRVHGRRQ